jgi:hypothetical protein
LNLFNTFRPQYLVASVFGHGEDFADASEELELVLLLWKLLFLSRLGLSTAALLVSLSFLGLVF